MKAVVGVLWVALLFWTACGRNDADSTSDVNSQDVLQQEDDVADPDLSAYMELQESAGDEVSEAQSEEIDATGQLFVEFDWLTEPADPSQRICDEADDPDGAPDKVYIHCRIEGEALATSVPEPIDELVVWAYNMERGGRLDDQIAAWLSGNAGPAPDILLLSELDRGCSRSGYRHVARELALAMGMNYLFSVEFVELQGEPGAHVAHCEHGNAILSRYPLGNVEALRHATQTVWYEDAGQPRLGGRIALGADVLVGKRAVHVYTVHFESSSEDSRSAQALETALAAEKKEGIVVVGGDMNCGLVMLDLMNGTNFDETLSQFTARGWFDAHAALAPGERVTAPEHNFVLDILVSNQDRFLEPEVGETETWGSMSDHLPVWATLNLE